MTRNSNSFLTTAPTHIRTHSFYFALAPQADLLLLAANLFRTPSADLMCLIADVTEAAGMLVRTADLPRTYSERIVAILTIMSKAVKSVSLGQLKVEYVRLFESAPACPLTETFYVRRDKGTILGDIAGFYRAFGVSVLSGEKPDHVSAELEFMAALLVMQIQAPTAEDTEVTYNALHMFVEDHVGEWLLLFTTHLAASTTVFFYKKTADLLASIWKGIAIVHGFNLQEVNPNIDHLATDTQ